MSLELSWRGLCTAVRVETPDGLGCPAMISNFWAICSVGVRFLPILFFTVGWCKEAFFLLGPRG